jgi:hypothetical protein
VNRLIPRPDRLRHPSYPDRSRRSGNSNLSRLHPERLGKAPRSGKSKVVSSFFADATSRPLSKAWPLRAEPGISRRVYPRYLPSRLENGVRSLSAEEAP